MSDHKVEAQKLLSYLSKGTMQYDVYIQRVRDITNAGGLSLEDVGTSEKNLKDLRTQCCVHSAKQWLERLSFGDSHYELYIDCMTKELSSCNLSFTDIGTNEDEIEKLRVYGCKISAQEVLYNLRNYNSNNKDLYVRCIRENLHRGGLLLEDIGSNENEIDYLINPDCNISSFGIYDD